VIVVFVSHVETPFLVIVLCVLAFAPMLGAPSALAVVARSMAFSRLWLLSQGSSLLAESHIGWE
jgi:hypothetical protein